MNCLLSSKVFSGSWKPGSSLFAETINTTALRFAPVGGVVIPNNPPEWNELDVSTFPDTYP